MKYYFKFKDTVLAELDFNGIYFRIVKRYVNAIVFPMLVSDKALNTWISNRPTSISRNNALELFKTAGIKTDEDFVNITNCLSIKDCIWVTKDRNKLWSSVSLFSNPFNRVFTEVARCDYGFRGRTIQTPSPELTIGGSSLKWCKKMNNKIYLYKSFGGLAELEFSGCYSEFFASQLCEYLGIYNFVRYKLSKVDGRVCSVSECYTSEGVSSIYVGELCNDMTHLDEHIKRYNGRLLKEFKDIMVLDCVLLNVDRHDENISFLYDNSFNITGLAPIYDFDHSLFYDLSLINRSDSYIMEKISGYVPKTYNNHTFLDQFKMCITPEMFRKLQDVYRSFKFSNSREYPIDSKRLDMINKVFRWNLGRLLSSVGGR